MPPALTESNPQWSRILPPFGVTDTAAPFSFLKCDLSNTCGKSAPLCGGETALSTTYLNIMPDLLQRNSSAKAGHTGSYNANFQAILRRHYAKSGVRPRSTRSLNSAWKKENPEDTCIMRDRFFNNSSLNSSRKSFSQHDIDAYYILLKFQDFWPYFRGGSGTRRVRNN